MNTIRAGVLWLLASMVASAYGYQKDGHRNYYSFENEPQRIKAAYKLRTDIDKTVAKTVCKWKTPGIPHSDWIDNLDGKSTDLQGNQLFPQIDYNRLYEVFPGIFVISNTRTSKYGIIKRNGQMLVPMDYVEYIDWKLEGEGLFIGKKTDNSTDIYHISGKKLCSILPTGDYYDEVHVSQKIISIRYRQNSSEKGFYNYHWRLFWYDGTPVMPEFIGASTITFNNKGNIESFTDNGITTYAITTEMSTPTETIIQPKDKNYVELQSSQALLKNVWIQTASKLMDEGKYADARECLYYYEHTDHNSQSKSTSSMSVLWQMWMQCALETQNYFNIIDKSPNFLPEGITLNPSQMEYSFDKKTYSAEAVPIVEEAIANCNAIYQEGKALWDKRSAAIDRRRARLNALSNYMKGAEKLMNSPSLLPSASTSASTNSGAAANAMPVHNVNNNGSATTKGSDSGDKGGSKTAAKHSKCKVCNGKGHCQTCDGTGRRVYGGKVQTCAACGGHPTCKACGGTGYKES